jgi:2-polyprenyl-6-methoxyphenol hydroxylase-like FAD-dependent oxidoreductase
VGTSISASRKQGKAGVTLTFEVNGQLQHTADLVVGADGIRSTVRRLVLGRQYTFTILDCIVILGICSLSPTSGKSFVRFGNCISNC